MRPAAIEAAYKRETDAEVRIGLIRALGAMGDRAVDVLQRLVTSSDTAVRATRSPSSRAAAPPDPGPGPAPSLDRSLDEHERE